jgi:hypothetical protein
MVQTACHTQSTSTVIEISRFTEDLRREYGKEEAEQFHEQSVEKVLS